MKNSPSGSMFFVLFFHKIDEEQSKKEAKGLTFEQGSSSLTDHGAFWDIQLKATKVACVLRAALKSRSGNLFTSSM